MEFLRHDMHQHKPHIMVSSTKYSQLMKDIMSEQLHCHG